MASGSQSARPPQTRYVALLRERKASPFYLEHAQSSAGVGRFKDLEQQRSRGASAKTPRQQQQALASIMTLSPLYFPEELYTSKDQQCALSPRTRTQWAPQNLGFPIWARNLPGSRTLGATHGDVQLRVSRRVSCGDVDGRRCGYQCPQLMPPSCSWSSKALGP